MPIWMSAGARFRKGNNMNRLTFHILMVSAGVGLFSMADRTSLDTALKAALLFAIGFVAGTLYVLDKTTFKRG